MCDTQYTGCILDLPQVDFLGDIFLELYCVMTKRGKSPLPLLPFLPPPRTLRKKENGLGESLGVYENGVLNFNVNIVQKIKATMQSMLRLF